MASAEHARDGDKCDRADEGDDDSPAPRAGSVQLNSRVWCSGLRLPARVAATASIRPRAATDPPVASRGRPGRLRTRVRTTAPSRAQLDDAGTPKRHRSSLLALPHCGAAPPSIGRSRLAPPFQLRTPTTAKPPAAAQPVSQLTPPDVLASQIWPRQASQSLRLTSVWAQTRHDVMKKRHPARKGWTRCGASITWPSATWSIADSQLARKAAERLAPTALHRHSSRPRL
jgi:hypothetical protein